jgi:hypothetical protein
MTPERRRRLRVILISIGSAVVFIVGAAIAISVVNQSVFSPSQQVSSYLGDVVAKDAAGALAVADVHAPNSARQLLTTRVMLATKSGVSGYSLASATTSGSTAKVVANLERDGDTTAVTYSLTRTGTTWLFFDTWKMDAVTLPTLDVQLAPGITQLDVNGAAVTLSKSDISAGYTTLPAFPGEYAVSVGGGNKFLTAKTQTATVGVSTTSPASAVQLSLEPSASFTASVTRQIASMLASCAAQQVLEPANCPFQSYWFGTITDVSWAITTPPTFTLSNSLGSTDWSVDTDSPGTATVTYTYSTPYSPAAQESDTASIYIEGKVAFVDGEPVYSYGY